MILWEFLLFRTVIVSNLYHTMLLLRINKSILFNHGMKRIIKNVIDHLNFYPHNKGDRWGEGLYLECFYLHIFLLYVLTIIFVLTFVDLQVVLLFISKLRKFFKIIFTKMILTDWDIIFWQPKWPRYNRTG